MGARSQKRIRAATYTPAAIASSDRITRPTCSGWASGRLGAIVRRRRRRHMRQTVGVADAFPVVVIGFSIAAIVVAVIVAISSGGLYERIGRDGLRMDRGDA